MNDGDALSKLSRELSSWIKTRMDNEIRSLPSTSRECRAVFTGPPEHLITDVFNELAGDGRLLSTEMPDGSRVSYPVVLQVQNLPPNAIEARADRSGPALFHGLAGIRNSHDIGIFLTLAPPGAQASDTHESTRKPFGLASTANEGGSPISTWWNDPFIQYLVDGGLGEGDEKQLEQAKRLVHEAIVAADSAMQHDVSRAGSWATLERLWEIRDSQLSLDARVSLATGFAPSEDGQVDATQKISVLASLVEKFERSSFGTGAEQLKEQCDRAGVAAGSVDAFMAHLRNRCDLVTALKRSMPFFYAPDEMAPAPEWWSALTVQKWEILLEDEGDSTPEIGISCANPMAFQLKGFVPVVRDAARIVVQLPEGMEGTQVRVTREGPGGAASRREWTLPQGGAMEFVDNEIPLQRTPFKYVAEMIPPANVKKAIVRLISLCSWEPGLIVCSRTATKGKVAKIAAGKPIETILEMSGAGRHYLDLYARPGVEILSSEAIAHGNDDEVIEPSRIGRIADDEYGMEVEAGSERFYELEIRRPSSSSPESFRINLVADESSPEECASYFEFHLAMNSRREGGRQPRAVHANSTSRSVQLQGWMIDERVYRTIVLPVRLGARLRDPMGASRMEVARGHYLFVSKVPQRPSPCHGGDDTTTRVHSGKERRLREDPGRRWERPRRVREPRQVAGNGRGVRASHWSLRPELLGLAVSITERGLLVRHWLDHGAGGRRRNPGASPECYRRVAIAPRPTSMAMPCPTCDVYGVSQASLSCRKHHGPGLHSRLTRAATSRRHWRHERSCLLFRRM